MPNNIAASLQLDEILGFTMEAFRESIPALRLFSTRFEPEFKGTDKVLVPYFPLDTNAAKDYDQANGYQLGGNSNIQHREVTIDKDKYVDLSFTDKEAARQPQLDQEHLVRMLGYNLAEQVFADILGHITAANFANSYGPVAANAFYTDDIQDIDTICDNLK